MLLLSPAWAHHIAPVSHRGLHLCMKTRESQVLIHSQVIKAIICPCGWLWEDVADTEYLRA